jgi:hypothetical protein
MTQFLAEAAASTTGWSDVATYIVGSMLAVIAAVLTVSYLGR